MVVVGAGPAGSAAALTLARRPGLEVMLVDRARFPRRKVCGSGLSPWALDVLDELGVGERVRREAYPINAALVGSSRTSTVELRGNDHAAVLLRERFDALLVEEAVRRGATLVEGATVREIVREAGRVVGVETSDGGLEADAVIDCSGANTRLSRTGRRGRTLHAILGWYEGLDGVTDAVELYFDAAVRPWYGWVFPETAERVNVGICFAPGGANAYERFDAFVEGRLAARMHSATRIGRLVGHPIATSWRARSLVADGVLTAGEAGSLVDSATAEGIYHALESGRLAAETLGDAIAQGVEPTADALEAYGRAVHRRLGRRLLAGRLLVGALRTPLLDIGLGLGSRPAVQAALTRALVKG